MMMKIVALAASTGGPQALSYIFRELSAQLPAAYVVVQHLLPEFVTYFAEHLAKGVSFQVQVATDGLILEPGIVAIAPPNVHLLVQTTDESPVRWQVTLSKDAPVGGHCPAADPLFASVADSCGKRGIGVILTGMGSDGAEGLLKIRQAAGVTIGQDAATSTVFGMPRAAWERGAVEKMVSLADIPAAITEAVLTP